jgi:DNA-binding response OmpR family regulator
MAASSDAGADDYIIKRGESFRELLARIQANVDHVSAFGDFRFTDISAGDSWQAQEFRHFELPQNRIEISYGPTRYGYGNL